MTEKILIVDFGSQYTQLIARRVRELNVFSEIISFQSLGEIDPMVKGVILSGSPFSVSDQRSPRIELDSLIGKRPILGICYGAQLMVDHFGGRVEPSSKREYGRAHLRKEEHKNDPILADVPNGSQVWMSHGDTILELPDNFELLAGTASIDTAVYRVHVEGNELPVYGLQFHPEVTHSPDGLQILRSFVHDVCGCADEWTPASFVESTVAELKEKLGTEDVVLGLSGGVDSSVAAMLLHRAIGPRLHCIFVDNGLLRKDEFEEVLHTYEDLGLNITGVKAGKRFIDALAGIEEPEAKRKAIGKTFIDVFQDEAERISGVKWLGQGTIYPDVIESASVHGPSATIKSHHNVGGLPETMNLELVEPLRLLFKDEVRKVGAELGLPGNILGRHPFPGPGLGIRILGEVSADRIRILQEADAIFIGNLKKDKLYDRIWQAGTILLPVRSVGVMGDERTYENVVALRAVHSLDGMTADWVQLPYEFLAKTSNDIINQVKGINRVVYDVSSKPPATIEWE